MNRPPPPPPPLRPAKHRIRRRRKKRKILPGLINSWGRKKRKERGKWKTKNCIRMGRGIWSSRQQQQQQQQQRRQQQFLFPSHNSIFGCQNSAGKKKEKKREEKKIISIYRPAGSVRSGNGGRWFNGIFYRSHLKMRAGTLSLVMLVEGRGRRRKRNLLWQS